MELKYVLFSLFGKPVTLFALCIMIALALGLVLIYREQKRMKLREDTTEIFALLALPLGLICSRLVYCLSNFRQYLYDLELSRMLHLWDGGYAMLGAFLGVAIAALLTGKITRQPASRILDAIAAPAALMIALCRFAEWANGQGVGMMVEIPFFQRFPFAVCNEWGEWYWAVFMLEGVAAWIIALTLQSKRIPEKDGNRAKMFVILICSSQTFFEILREDAYLRLDPWFIRITQVGALALLVAVMIAALISWRRLEKAQRISGGKMALYWFLFAACAGVNIWMQFAVQKSADLPVWACYGIMGLTSIAFGIISYRVIFRYQILGEAKLEK